MSNIWNDAAGVPTSAREPRDSRPPSVRSQNTAIWEYAARNRLLRSGGTPEDVPGSPQTPEASRSGWTRRRPGRGAPRTAAMAEGIYHRIAPPAQKYPLRAVALIRRLLQEGAPEEFVLGKYRMHAWACGDLGVTPMLSFPTWWSFWRSSCWMRRLSGQGRLRRDPRSDGTAGPFPFPFLAAASLAQAVSSSASSRTSSGTSR